MTDFFSHLYTDTEISRDQDFVSAPNIVRTDKDLTIKDFYNFGNVEFGSRKGRKIGLTIVSGGTVSIYNAQLTDLFIAVSDVTISRSVVLPKSSLAGVGKLYFVKDISGSALSTTIAITPTGTELINGDTSTQLAVNYGFLSFFTDGNNWFTQ